MRVARVLQFVLAVLFLSVGVLKLTVAKPRLVTMGLRWAADVAPIAIRGIGALELFAGLALLGALVITSFRPLAAAAALGLAVLMVGAEGKHLLRREWPNVLMCGVLLVLAIYVASHNRPTATSQQPVHASRDATDTLVLPAGPGD